MPNAVPVAAVLALTGVVAVLAAGLLGHRQGAASATVGPAPASGSIVPGSASATVGPAPASGSTVRGPADPAAILAALDRIRSDAYAQRRPELLARVYRSPSLLAQDTAQLARTVPVGCRLAGLSTDYRQLEAVAGKDRLQVRVTARLTAGSLYCAGTVRGRTPAVGPLRLLLSLTDTATGYLVDGERLLGAGT